MIVEHYKRHAVQLLVGVDVGLPELSESGLRIAQSLRFGVFVKTDSKNWQSAGVREDFRAGVLKPNCRSDRGISRYRRIARDGSL